jgi:cytidylate kinase
MADLPKIIGLAGTNGSGKDTVGALLANDFGYKFISVTELLRDELKKRGLEITRTNMRDLSAEWRREANNLGVLVDKAMDAFTASSEQYVGLVVSSLRNPGEVDSVHKLGGIVMWLDADPNIRYERIRRNSHLRGRDGEDNISFSEFMEQQAAEMTPHTASDDALLNMLGVKAKADIFIDNSTTSEALEDSIKKALIK